MLASYRVWPLLYSSLRFEVILRSVRIVRMTL